MRSDQRNFLTERIREVLLAEWKPFGFSDGLPRDEFDSYIPHILKLVTEGRAGIDGLTSHLNNLQRISMGIEPSADNNRRVATLLQDLVGR